MKDDRNTNTISLDSGDVQIMTKEIDEATQTSFKSIEEWQGHILGKFTHMLKDLCKSVEYV